MCHTELQSFCKNAITRHQENNVILRLMLGGIIFSLPIYGMTNLEQYSVFHGI